MFSPAIDGSNRPTKSHYYCVMLISLLLSNSFRVLSYAQAEETAHKSFAVELSVEDAVEAALANNRDLIAARFTIQQAEGRLRQAGLWPNPELELGRNSDRSFSNEGEYLFSTKFQQSFPVSGRIAKAKDVARVDVAMAMAEIRNEERILIAGVLSKGRELLVLNEQLRANKEIQAVIGNFLDISKKRFAAAEVSSADVNVIKLELQKMKLVQAKLENQYEVAAATFAQLLGKDPQDTVRIVGVIPTEIENREHLVTEDVVSMRPDYQQALLNADRAAAEVILAKAQRWEDWTVGFEYERERQSFDAPIGNQKDKFLGLTVSVPLPIWNQNQGSISESEAGKRKAKAELEALKQRIMTEVQSASNQARRLKAVLHQDLNESLKLANANVTLIQKGYEDGLIEITAVVQAQQQYSELRQSYWDTVAEFVVAVTELESATASSPFLSKEFNSRSKL